MFSTLSASFVQTIFWFYHWFHSSCMPAHPPFHLSLFPSSWLFLSLFLTPLIRCFLAFSYFLPSLFPGFLTSLLFPCLTASLSYCLAALLHGHVTNWVRASTAHFSTPLGLSPHSHSPIPPCPISLHQCFSPTFLSHYFPLFFNSSSLLSFIVVCFVFNSLILLCV